jgi:N-acetylglucosaminyl-diphospho-decaprenol L-rhamnosyltransferase
MDLSIIIVNWNSKQYLRKCIDSILVNTRDIQFEIIVIDSASFDGAGELVREHFPEVFFIQSERNVGFAQANNAAFRHSSGDCLLFLNPDTEVQGSAINAMYARMKDLKDAGAVGCKLLNSDGSIQTSCVRAFPNLANQLLDADVLREHFPRLPFLGMAPLFRTNGVPQAVDAISGACLMVRRTVFEQVGLFSTDYFMYSEDVDLCYKIYRAGWKNYYIPESVIVHHGGASSSQAKVSTFASIMMLESRWRFFTKTRSRSYCYLYRVCMFVVSVARLILALVAWAFSSLIAKGTRWKNAVVKWNGRLRWTLGLESWVRNYTY